MMRPMQMTSRSFIPVGLAALLLSGTSGCKKSDPPQPTAEAQTASAASPKLRPTMRNPMGPMPKIDPQAMKEYRLDLCYYGTLSLRQARDSYLGSLGKDEPSEKKLPSFGMPNPPPATPPVPGASAAAAPSAKAPPAAAPPSASAPPSTRPPIGSRPYDFALRAPHERNARACSSVVGLKEPAMGDVDAAVAAFAPFASDLAKDIVTANAYYQREEYKSDKMAKGKELHKKLLGEFAKLDELQDKLGAAMNAWHKDHPADASKQDEGEKAVIPALDNARAIVVNAVAKKPDVAVQKDNVTKLEAALTSLREFSTSHPDDVWAKIMIGPIEVFLKSAKELKLGEKTYDAEGTLSVINNFTSVIEARQRALTRAMIAKGQTTPAGSAAGAPAGLPPGHPPMPSQ